MLTLNCAFWHISRTYRVKVFLEVYLQHQFIWRRLITSSQVLNVSLKLAFLLVTEHAWPLHLQSLKQAINQSTWSLFNN